MPPKLLPEAPIEFEGTLDDLYCRYIEPILPTPAAVERIHHLLVQHTTRPNPLLLLRQRSKTTRGEERELPEGGTIRWTDNSPAWWMHHLTFTEIQVQGADQFEQLLREAPVHFFENARAGSGAINQRGWHVAHLLAAKPRSWAKNHLSKGTAMALFVRNIHPANHFYLPKTNWQALGESTEVLAFVAEKFASRYRTIWSDFLQMAGLGAASELNALPAPNGAVHVSIQPKPSASQRVQTSHLAVTGDVKLRYRYARLTFVRNRIEPLAWDDSFQVDTNEGSFILTKRQFYDLFPGVVASVSYRELGNYNYKTVPAHALAFRVD